MATLTAAPSTRRLRLIQLLTLVILVVAFAATLLLVADPNRRAQLYLLIESPFGLIALFILSIISNATLLMPVPGLALTAIAASAGDPIIVGIVAGVGQALGEITGYLAGYSGQELVDNSRFYPRIAGWMQRYGAATIFLLALIPNPFFDVAGIVAGASRMSIWVFLGSATAGKIIKNVALALAASMGIHWMLGLFGK